MQTVSDAWKENQKQSFVNESFIRITLGFNDPEASESAAASDNGSLSIAPRMRRWSRTFGYWTANAASCLRRSTEIWGLSAMR